MNLGIAGKSVFITGGSKGIGFACAGRFLMEGAKVAIASRSQSNLDAALERLSGAFGVAADLVEADQATHAIEAAEQAIGPLSILVNSAGAAVRTPPDELTPAAWRKAFDAKFFSYINVIDPVVKRMAARGTGVIINIIGNGGKAPSPTHLAGGSANAALMLATAGLGAAYAPQGVRVVGINPGLTETDRVTQGLRAEAKLAQIDEVSMREVAYKRIPLGRAADPYEIADMALFLSSERAAYVTAVTITMDGAQSPSIM
ncbi:SDR family NAD(P)-dependent oxidoreductase [Terrarubrum flagellatum]|uniref:SDR family NAD(P)-dependent oxidoreductase n=1 Tax=Terrirubrum flagellatum TaxID=2895980 RepID=UPI003144E04B